MAAVVVDTSAWISFLRGETIPELEAPLKDVRVVLSPIVLAEILSGAKSRSVREQLLTSFGDLQFFKTDKDHWISVGDLRRKLSEKGLSISTPDAHIVQCALDLGGELITRDKIFSKVREHANLKLIFF